MPVPSGTRTVQPGLHRKAGPVTRSSHPQNATIRKVLLQAEQLLYTGMFMQFTLCCALSIRAQFFPGHCAQFTVYTVCLPG